MPESFSGTVRFLNSNGDTLVIIDPDSVPTPIVLVDALGNILMEITMEADLRLGLAETFIPGVDLTRVALHHKAQAAARAGEIDTAIGVYRELAQRTGNASEPLFEAGLVAEAAGRKGEAADLYRSAAADQPSSSTDSAAELSRRALLRLEDSRATCLPAVASQDYRFGHPGTDSIAEPRLRCNVFALLSRSILLSSPVRLQIGSGQGVPATPAATLPTPLRPCLSATPRSGCPALAALPSGHRQRPDPAQHVTEQPPVQMSLGQQQPVVAGMFDQTAAGLH